MRDNALYDVVCDVGVVPTTQRLRKNRAPDRTLVIIITSYCLINAQLAIAFFACALSVKGCLLAIRMQTTHTRRTRLHDPAMANTHVRHSQLPPFTTKDKKSRNISFSAYS